MEVRQVSAHKLIQADRIYIHSEMHIHDRAAAKSLACAVPIADQAATFVSKAKAFHSPELSTGLSTGHRARFLRFRIKSAGATFDREPTPAERPVGSASHISPASRSGCYVVGGGDHWH